MKKKRIWLVIFIISIIVFLIGVAGIILEILPHKTPDLPSTTDESVTQFEDPRPVNPIDFSSLFEENPDIYAWIRLPGTNIDYPILQSSVENDDYYLRRDWKKNYNRAGSIYTQRKNKKDFSDPNTLIYGHNWHDGTMFSSLLKFKDEDFFEKNRYIQVYLPGRLLTYEIYAAYLYDDRHILLSFDFSNSEIFEKYLESTLNPTTMVKTIREGMSLTAADRIVTLSTCPHSNISEPKRYLVQGVLIKDEETR
ncbi:MAG TPA: class B sortase [Clostridiales bacterium]|nr:class B sortase [Clostridiales bacterium]